MESEFETMMRSEAGLARELGPVPMLEPSKAIEGNMYNKP